MKYSGGGMNFFLKKGAKVRLIRTVAIGSALGFQDVKQAYRRSAIGPFWLTLGMAVQVAAIGLVFGLIFGSPLEEFLPYIATSLVIWSFISSSIVDGSMSFVVSEAIIRQLSLGNWVHIFRSLWKHFLTFSHNLVIIPVVFFIFLKEPSWNLLLLLPASLVTMAFLFSTSFCLALVTTRYRDMQQITTSVLTVVFYVTPVIWQPSLIPTGTAYLLLGLNPFYHFLQIIRLPILGQAPTFENWALAISMTLAAGGVAFLAAKKYKNRLAYWV
jgi:lipopolysaccharide transport system permease protein